MPKAGSPLIDCRIIWVMVPLTSASQLQGVISSLNKDMAPQAAQPNSVKNSGQQRTAKPSRPF